MAKKGNWIMIKKVKNNKFKFVAVSQILSMILEIFAFSFIIGGMAVGISTTTAVAIPSVSAAETKGCCIEGNDGSICQDMNLLDAANCKTSLLSTSCATVDNCLVGCCYNPDGGDCSLNAPKDQCVQTGGNWSSDALCNIQECQLGCCVLGDQAQMTTSRECTKLSQDLNFERKFDSLDSDGTCNSQSDLAEEGACVSSTGDYSGENNCKFGTKDDCQRTGGSFYQNYLCTAESLHTVCYPSKDTTCIEGKDQVYYLDDCGNLANVYDANRFGDQTYWETVIQPTDSCAGASADCGNCDYLTGSVCSAYRTGKDTKPTYGDNVCRNLNCVNGRTHGESWCINDYNTETPAVAPVGSRAFVGKCLDGEISIEPCADFNQEICISSGGTPSEAKCIANEWRSCIAANQKTEYKDIQKECSKYEQCSMILDINGNEKYATLPGFRKEIPLEWQGASADLGKDANKQIVWCVPKYTPGFIFWQDSESLTNADLFPTAADGTTETTSATTNSGMDSGGSLAETAAICSLGSFTCVSHKQRTCELVSKDITDPEAFLKQYYCVQTLGVSAQASNLLLDDAECKPPIDKENWECNIDGVTKTISTEELPKVLEAYNERCRSIGSCGSYINVAGQVGSNDFNSAVKRTKIDRFGKTKEDYNKEGYVLSESYLGSFVGKAGLIPAGTLTSLTGAVIFEITGRVGESEFINTMTEGANYGYSGTTSAATTPTAITPTSIDWKGVGWNIITIIAISYAANQIAGMIAKKQGWSAGMQSAWVLGVTATAGAAISIYFIASAGCATGVLCPISIALAVLPAIYTNCIGNEFKENEYYALEYTCQAWEPPQKGDCNLCNKDIRACSENRCKSLGLNCEYYNDKGEPGWCAAIDDTWSAKINPWPEALTEGNMYSSITSQSFEINSETSENGKVGPWQTLEFGIITDKPATCKIDNKHTASFDEMAVEMIREIPAYSAQEAQGNILGTYHRVALSSYVDSESSGDATLSLVTGEENNYYIRCENYAGLGNEAEFAVKVIVENAPDLTPPYIKEFSPLDESYLGLGTNSTSVLMYVDEPAECRYSVGVNNNFEQMTGTMSCLTSDSSSVFGKWPCYTALSNLTVDANTFYFTCKDKPGSEERTVAETRIVNQNPVKYTLNVCSKGLDITSVSPANKIVTGKSPVSLTLEAQTAGCISGGVSTCYYEFSSGGGRIQFSQTDSTSHKQIFDSLASSEHNITIYCEDEAGNNDQTSILVKVELDNAEPKVLKAFQSGENLAVVTNENTVCKYMTNSTLGCSFNYDTDKSETMTGTANYHYATWVKNLNYYIKCKDEFGNQNFDCGIRLRTY
ncbi:MAG: hypothetical protein AABX17_02385 [Nanoarchaeota archaeon]